MDTYVFLAVLAAALCHAAWNAGLKMRVEPLVAVTILGMAGGAVALPLVAVVGVPARAAWGYLAASIVVHVVYFWALAEAYRTGDLGQVYPVARGTAPLLTTVGSLLILGEALGFNATLGVMLLTCGVLLLSLKGGRPLAEVDRRAVGYALLTACTTATYTLIDGQGARASGNAHAYAVWFFILNGIAVGIVGFLREPVDLKAGLKSGVWLPLGGGVLSFVSYWVALWAMTKAPIALVAAVRETSVLFAALIGVMFLKEPMLAARVMATALVAGGLVLMRV